MDPFDEWVKTQPHPCLQPWVDRLIELGSSWDSFRRDSNEVVEDLVSGGIPLLAARDIVNIATQTLQKSQAPMAIFWDLENLPIPSLSSGREVAMRLKSILAPHGNLVQFRGYASIGEANIPQQKRSDLQLSGCHLVDCPHVGRKEVVDKMIIVDAMHFAFTHPDAATLCFITGDVDYAYLLAVLQQRPQWRTIVISRGTIRSMLHVNCDMKMRWETDILQMSLEAPSATALPPPAVPPGFETQLKAVDSSNEVDEPSIKSASTVEDEDGDEDTSSDNSTVPNDDSVVSFEPLTRDEQWDDDTELLRITIRGAPQCDGLVLKSFVGNSLRQTNPARFRNRESVREFLANAIEKGVIIETGEGAYKTLSLATSDESSSPMPVSDQAPMSFQDMPAKFFEVASSRPFLLFVPWSHYPKGIPAPDKAFFQASKKYAILLFRKLNEVSRATQENPSCRMGHLVDWRQMKDTEKLFVPRPHSHISKSSLSSIQKVPCAVCGQPNAPNEMITRNDDGQYCGICATKFTPEWKTKGKGHAIQKVVKMMETLEANDDISVLKSLLRKFLVERWPTECPTRAHAGLWIHEATEDNILVNLPKRDTKSKALVCLTRLYQEAMAAILVYQPSTFDTSKEEALIVNLLWNGAGWMRKIDAISSLEATFEPMKRRLYRAHVFANASQNGRFFVGRGPLGQTVVLNKEDVKASLERLVLANDNEEDGHGGLHE